MPVMRAAAGTLLLVLAIPVLFVGAGLAVVGAHRGPDGTYSADIERLHIDGYAAEVPDIDALLRHDAPFARGGQTTLRITASDPAGPLFVGLARQRDVETYLSGVGHTRIVKVGLARGPLPIQTLTLVGTMGGPAVPPAAAPLWVRRASGVNRAQPGGGPLTWSPSAMRDAGMALVVMRADGSSGFDLTLRAALSPAWLTPTIWGLLTLGGSLLPLAVVLLVWPRRRRDPTTAVAA